MRHLSLSICPFLLLLHLLLPFLFLTITISFGLRAPILGILKSMANGTRISKMDEAVQRLLETSDRQQRMMTEIMQKRSAIDNKCDRLFQDFRHERGENLGYLSRSHQENEKGTGIQSRTIRLEFPRFDGTDPSRWIYKAE